MADYVDSEHFNVDPDTYGLRTLYPPEGEDRSILVDIVAVHGLGGDAIQTWTATNGSDSKLWLSDILPGVLKKDILTSDSSYVRVLTFGYDASIFVQPAEANTKRLQNFASALLNGLDDDDLRQDEDKNRPIIFIGHSLGGLVIKQALNIAHSNSTLGHILASTKAIHFYSTPHAGANVKAWAEVLGRMSGSLGMAGTSQTAKALGTWSPELLDLSDAFTERATGIAITTFYETMAEPGGVMVVDEGSARSGPSGSRIVPLNKTHREMCRFMTLNDSNGKTILQRMKADVRTIYKAALKSQG
ncbi:uncharacterized protein H6S33_001908 [Morchella sextelata]|uniref:uncharacterized protein n=1 Tax=Morchella sextelata TaxID=1174677 RepID=UPI001D04F611|nr:uncharacterized protein H6S33_001908 [Morchella sextelata]KAH0607856.1 hypothetical protein H6S33_001908 [Morchella sextelata]